MSKFYDFLKSAEVAVKRKLAASSLYEFQAPVELRGSSDIESALAKRNISLEANKSNSALPLPYKRELYERLCRGNTRENDTVNNEVLKKGRDAGRSDTTLLQASESSKSFKDILGYFESSCSRVVRQNYNTNDLQRPWHINPPKIKQIEPIVETSTFCGHCAQQNSNLKAPRRDNRTSGMIFLNRPKRETKPNIKVDNSSFAHCCASMKNSLEETRKCRQSSGMIFLDHIQRKHTPKINEDKMNFEHYCRCKKKKHEAVIAEKSFKSIRDICEQAKCSAFDRKEALRKSVTPVVENLNNMSSSFKQFACAVMDKYMPKNAVGVQKIDNNKENNEFICIQKEEKCSKDISQIFKETCSKRKRKTCQTMESKEHNDQQNKSSEPECKRRKSIFQEQCSQRCNTFKMEEKYSKDISQIFKESCSKRKRKTNQTMESKEHNDQQNNSSEPESKRRKSIFQEQCSQRCNTLKVPKIRNMNASSVRENKPCNQQPKTLPVQGSVPLIGFQTNNVQMEQSPDKSFHVVTEKACEVFGTKEQTSRTDYKSSRRKKVYEVTTPSREETNIKNTVESPCYRLSKMKNIKEMKTKGYSLSKKKTRPPKMTPVSLEGYTPYKEDDLSLINSPRTVAYSYRPRKPSVAGNKKVTEKRNLGTSHVIKGKNVDLIRRLLSLKTGIKPSLSLLNETVHSRGHPEGLWHNVKMDSMSKKVLQYMTARKC